MGLAGLAPQLSLWKMNFSSRPVTHHTGGTGQTRHQISLLPRCLRKSVLPSPRSHHIWQPAPNPRRGEALSCLKLKQAPRAEWHGGVSRGTGWETAPLSRAWEEKQAVPVALGHLRRLHVGTEVKQTSSCVSEAQTSSSHGTYIAGFPWSQGSAHKGFQNLVKFKWIWRSVLAAGKQRLGSILTSPRKPLGEPRMEPSSMLCALPVLQGKSWLLRHREAKACCSCCCIVA